MNFYTPPQPQPDNSWRNEWYAYIEPNDYYQWKAAGAKNPGLKPPAVKVANVKDLQALLRVYQVNADFPIYSYDDKTWKKYGSVYYKIWQKTYSLTADDYKSVPGR